MEFKAFDQRKYPTITPRAGYAEWAATYDASVPDVLDISVLEKLQSVRWAEVQDCLDLACGTGRIGSWLKQKGVLAVDGVDLTPEMLGHAKTKGIYRSLHEGSVESTALGSSRYDLAVMCLVDEHLAQLGPTYQEASRLCSENGRFVVVGMHPFFFMMGMPTHYNDSQGRPKAIETHVHLFGDHFSAANAAGWKLQEVIEGVIDDDWIQAKPKWERFRSFPVNYGYVWSRQ